jgi:hypothetical protein
LRGNQGVRNLSFHPGLLSSRGSISLGINEFKAEQGNLSAELKLLIIDAGEMGLDEDTEEIVVDKARGLIARIDDSVTERELDRIKDELGRLQSVLHQALLRKKKD